MGKVEQIGNSGPEVTSGDILMEMIRSGAQQILAKALEVESSEFLETYRELRDSEGRQRWCAMASCRLERSRPA